MDKKLKEEHFLRKQWSIGRKTDWKSNKDYIPSHKREGFDESKVIKLK
jgi:hypothetical protein